MDISTPSRVSIDSLSEDRELYICIRASTSKHVNKKRCHKYRVHWGLKVGSYIHEIRKDEPQSDINPIQYTQTPLNHASWKSGPHDHIYPDIFAGWTNLTDSQIKTAAQAYQVDAKTAYHRLTDANSQIFAYTLAKTISDTSSPDLEPPVVVFERNHPRLYWAIGKHAAWEERRARTSKVCDLKKREHAVQKREVEAKRREENVLAREEDAAKREEKVWLGIRELAQGRAEIACREAKVRELEGRVGIGGRGRGGGERRWGRKKNVELGEGRSEEKLVSGGTIVGGKEKRDFWAGLLRLR